MAGKRQPTDVVVANGKKHMTRAEEDARRDADIKVPKAKAAKPPKWLPEALKKDFHALGKQLIAAGLYTALDEDTLGRYLVAQHQWLLATGEAEKALVEKSEELAKSWSQIQERYFKQARNCASDLGLSISARCRLVIPPALQGGGDTGEEDEFTARLQRRQADALAGRG